MASTIDKIKNDIIEAVNASQKQTSAYDTEAEVVRIDGNTAWVHIAGGVSETPVAMTINAQKGDKVQVRVANDGAWLIGNVTAPPTDDKKANEADKKAVEAKYLAVDAADAAIKAGVAAKDAITFAGVAKDAAKDAEENAANASNYASRALSNLSTVQNVSETLNRIASHGTMVLTEDDHLDPSHVYFIKSDHGEYVVNDEMYDIVTEPTINDISIYYELRIDESLNNYVLAHLVLGDNGLSIFADNENDPLTYALISSIALSFILDGTQRLKVGYEESIDDYGVISNNHIALGSGAGVKFDNYGHDDTGARGRFVWEVRNNGHLSLKLY